MTASDARHSRHPSIACISVARWSPSGHPRDPPRRWKSALNAKGSLFLTRPGLSAHATDVEEYRKRVLDVFDAVERGVIRPAIWKTYALSDVAQAHEALESGKSAGAIVLKP
jgi:NADPH:quinone reductase